MSKKKGSKTSTLENIGSVFSPIVTYGIMSATGRGDEFKHTTQGRWWRKPSTKFPETKTDNSAAQIAAAASEAAMATAKEKERLRLKASSGRRSLISTSGAGVLEPATTNKKKLTGE